MLLAACLTLHLLRPIQTPAEPTWKSLFESKRYFELRDSLEAPGASAKADFDFYQGAVANKFNRPGDSASTLEAYVFKAASQYLKRKALELLADDYLKSYRYGKAADTYDRLIVSYSSVVSTEDQKDFVNTRRMCDALRAVPPQTVELRGDTSLVNQTKRGIKVPITLGETELPLLVDTGANVSVVCASLAQKSGMKVLDTTIQVGSITGKKVDAKLGTLEELSIGNATVRNAVFLIFEDKDLTPVPNFLIEGVIGFPIIQQLGELTLTKSGEVQIPAKPTAPALNNLCIDGLTPLIEGWFRGERLTFAFDTGADSTFLYMPFLKSHEAFVKANGTEADLSIGGVGAMSKIPSYKLSRVDLKFAGKEVALWDVPVLKRKTLENSAIVFGNVGQDVIQKFDRTTISFSKMSIVFE